MSVIEGPQSRTYRTGVIFEVTFFFESDIFGVTFFWLCCNKLGVQNFEGKRTTSFHRGKNFKANVTSNSSDSGG